MVYNKKGLSLIETIISISLIILLLNLLGAFLVVYVNNYISIYRDLSSLNEILFALNSIEENIYISNELLNEINYKSDETNLSLGYYDEGIYKKVSYNLYQNKIRKKMENITYLTTDACKISELKFFYHNGLISFALKKQYGNYLSNINGNAVIPGKT